ncbi:TRM11 family SAM-dependent methyltransferase [Vulcanisaeta souniana]|uniref:Ribosomal RNA large subunit methyltransferase K/L-like methyltransferase domain-containing protein n=1 Tax=Vulcanisaeta souniana JCM 11219 TaxID=1293586 RepID=A0A830EFS0_9CREN|nr:RNA methyltransferase [Vulcanisaeta souniana]BDR91120.1 hypothetical protein Vsou_02130 [Vulcanisaeta souniana JCM 11219]GGI80966.1 hypothetical protein GCM10007112_17210 [Vulcanisaeta souniana JCM 11219]
MARVRLRVEVSQDLKALAYSEILSIIELSGGSAELIDESKGLLMDYNGNLESLGRKLCRAALTRHVWVVEGDGERKFLDLDRSRYRVLKLGRRNGSVNIDLRIARLLVNLSRADYGSVFLDPFVGSGLIAYEAAMIGAYVMGIDINLRPLRSIQGEYIDAINSDSLLGPTRDGAVDSIATDPPYNRLSISDIDLDTFYRKLAEEAYRVLRSRGYIAFSHPTYVDSLDWFLNVGFELVANGLQYVHGSLTRIIYVFRKP